MQKLHIIDGSKTKRLTAPGIYTGIDSSDYHGNVCAGYSLSSSMARELLSECPAYVWHNSYLNPNRVVEPQAHFEFGTAAHLVFLEPDLFAERVVVVDADDWRGKAAKEARDEARDSRKVPLLRKDFAALEAMRNALHQHPVARHAFVGGVAELSVSAQDPTGIWLKGRPDYMASSLAYIVDYKTSATAKPDEFARKAYSYGYHMQAAWYLDIVKAATGETVKDFWFVVQEKSAPFLVSVCRFDDDAIAAGRVQNRRAIDLFARCLETGTWPGYRDAATPDLDTAFVLSLPRYAEQQVQQLLAAE